MCNKIICNDALSALQLLPSEVAQAVITSPPYFQQRDYCGIGIGNESSVNEYLDNLMVIFNECIRVVSNNGHIIFNLGDKYHKGSLMLIPYRFAALILDKHPQLRLVNNLLWIKSNPTPKQDKRKLINATEPFFIFAKSNKYVFNYDNFLSYEDTPLEPQPNTKIGQGYFAMIEESDLEDHEKANAKVELENAIEEIRKGKIAGLRMKIRGMHAEAYGGQSGGRQLQQQNKGFTIIKLHGKAMKKDVICNAVATIKGNKHPAVFPQQIVEEMIKLCSSESDLIIDPFIGSGTTALAAINTNRKFLGVEISPEYCEFAKENIQKFKSQISTTSSSDTTKSSQTY